MRKGCGLWLDMTPTAYYYYSYATIEHYMIVHKTPDAKSVQNNITIVSFPSSTLSGFIT